MWQVYIGMNSVSGSLAKKVKNIARDVYRTLGTGFSEFVYDRAMQVGLRLAKIPYENQKVVELVYRGHYVGEGYPDLVVRLGRQQLVVELKAISSDLSVQEAQQLKNYLRYLKISKGLLINFQQPERRERKPGLEIKEVSI